MEEGRPPVGQMQTAPTAAKLDDHGSKKRQRSTAEVKEPAPGGQQSKAAAAARRLAGACLLQAAGARDICGYLQELLTTHMEHHSAAPATAGSHLCPLPRLPSRHARQLEGQVPAQLPNLHASTALAKMSQMQTCNVMLHQSAAGSAPQLQVAH